MSGGGTGVKKESKSGRIAGQRRAVFNLLIFQHLVFKFGVTTLMNYLSGNNPEVVVTSTKHFVEDTFTSTFFPGT